MFRLLKVKEWRGWPGLQCFFFHWWREWSRVLSERVLPLTPTRGVGVRLCVMGGGAGVRGNGQEEEME